MPRRRRTSKVRDYSGHNLALMIGPVTQAEREMDPEDLRPAWEIYGDGILAEYAERHPGERPWGWWMFEADDPVLDFEDDGGLSRARDRAELAYLLETGEVGLDEARAVVRHDAESLFDQDDWAADADYDGHGAWPVAWAAIAVVQGAFPDFDFGAEVDAGKHRGGNRYAQSAADGEKG